MVKRLTPSKLVVSLAEPVEVSQTMANCQALFCTKKAEADVQLRDGTNMEYCREHTMGMWKFTEAIILRWFKGGDHGFD